MVSPTVSMMITMVHVIFFLKAHWSELFTLKFWNQSSFSILTNHHFNIKCGPGPGIEIRGFIFDIRQKSEQTSVISIPRGLTPKPSGEPPESFDCIFLREISSIFPWEIILKLFWKVAWLPLPKKSNLKNFEFYVTFGKIRNVGNEICAFCKLQKFRDRNL